MNRKQPLPIRSSLWLAVSVTAASIVLGGGALYEYRLHQNDEAARWLNLNTIAETYSAQLAPLILTGRWSEARQFVQELPLHPHVRLLAVLDPGGVPLAQSGDQSLLKEELPGKDLAASRQNRFWKAPAPNTFVYLVSKPIVTADGRSCKAVLVCGIRVQETLAAARKEFWQFCGFLLLAALAGTGLGMWYLNRSVVQPLRLLSRHQPDASAGKSPQLPTGRKDEIGDLARTLSERDMDIEQWRHHTIVLKHRYASRIHSETARMTRQLKLAQRKIWTDPLTGLGNRRMRDEKFNAIFNAQRGLGEDLTLIMIDLDNFKMVNDTLGHQAGDHLLQFTGELLSQCVRQEDLAIRFGGDEFMLVLPGVSSLEAARIAQRTLSLFAQQARLVNVKPRPGMSIGIVSLLEHRPGSASAMLDMADQALYAAKGRGKSRVVIFGSHAEEPAGEPLTPVGR